MRTPHGLEGLLLADKPAGPTSHDIVAETRRFTAGMRVGHTGTLDPFATGLLPLCIGRATRLSRFLTGLRKSYAGTLCLGTATDTYDVDGKITHRGDAKGVDEAAVRQAAARFVGTILQTPPPFSARKINGRRMYKLARKGVEVRPEPSEVTVFRFEILGVEDGLVHFEAETSAGTYVRALAHDLGAALGCGAHLFALRRVASGSHRVEDAYGLEEIRERGAAGSLGEIVIPLSRIDLGLHSVTATPRGATAMRTGQVLSAKELVSHGAGGAPQAPVRVLDQEGTLLGVAVPDERIAGGAILKPQVVLA